MKTNTIEFFRAALIRALRTGAQSILSMVAVGVGLFDVDWKTIISVSLMAMLISLLTSIVTGLPEVDENGVFLIDDSGHDAIRWTLQYNGDPNELKHGQSVRFKVIDANVVQNSGGTE